VGITGSSYIGNGDYILGDFSLLFSIFVDGTFYLNSGDIVSSSIEFSLISYFSRYK
jgi:hypothetical protein